MHCTEDIDECESDPCANGATCVNLRGKYKCMCASGFHGSNCNKKSEVDFCAVSSCQNGGTCLVSESAPNT